MTPGFFTAMSRLAGSVHQKYAAPESYDQEMALRGYETACACGLGRACFSGRILSNFVEHDEMKIASFLLGAVLQEDVAAFQNSRAIEFNSDMQIIIAGKNPLRQAMADILRHVYPNHEISEYVPDSVISTAKRSFLQDRMADIYTDDPCQHCPDDRISVSDRSYDSIKYHIAAFILIIAHF